nr:hypothetical protein [Clostridium botulinum]
MDSKLLQKVDKVERTVDVIELNKYVTKEDWILLGAISNPQDNNIIYHIGHLKI